KRQFRNWSLKSLAKSLCNVHTGVGADGLVFIYNSNSKNFDLVWDFYNSDGSKAEMCGNAARCVGRFMQDRGLTDPIRLKTGAGLVTVARQREDQFAVTMPKVTKVLPRQKLKIASKTINYTFV